MDAIEDILAELRKRGHNVGVPYIQTDEEASGGRMYIPIDGVAMTYPEIREFARRQSHDKKVRAD